MDFKDCKSGYPVYLLDRNSMRYQNGSIVSVSVPHADAKIGGALNMVVDVTATFGGDTKTYCMVANTNIAYPCGCVLSTEQSAIKREVESIKAQSEQALAQMDSHRTTVEKCKTLLAELDPIQKEKQENEARFSKLETNMETIMGMLKKIVD